MVKLGFVAPLLESRVEELLEIPIQHSMHNVVSNKSVLTVLEGDALYGS